VYKRWTRAIEIVELYLVERLAEKVAISVGHRLRKKKKD